MKRAWQFIGIIAYWVTVPGIWLVLRRTQRSRVIISYEDSIVVVKPWLGNGKWCLPGGGVHKNESALSAVRRETEEEVGMKLSPKTYRSIGNQHYRQNGLSFIYQLFSVALNEKISIRKQLLEIVEADWVPTTELNDKNANQDVLVGIEKTNS